MYLSPATKFSFAQKSVKELIYMLFEGTTGFVLLSAFDPYIQFCQNLDLKKKCKCHFQWNRKEVCETDKPKYPHSMTTSGKNVTAWRNKHWSFKCTRNCIHLVSKLLRSLDGLVEITARFPLGAKLRSQRESVRRYLPAHPVIKLVIWASGTGFPILLKMARYQASNVDTYYRGVGSPAGLRRFLRGYVGNYISRLQNNYDENRSFR
jgi:hypothetical protein